MPNPVVVFLDSTKREVPADLVFPIGFSVDGRKLLGPEISGQTCSVIILDDSVPSIPSCGHVNKESESLLLVVFHANSTLHSAVAVKGQLASWGTAMPWESFQHTLGNTIFDEIIKLIGRPEDAAGFSARHGAEFILASLDQLAANCQIGLLTEPDEYDLDFWNRQGVLTSMLPRDFVAAFHKETDWTSQIALIREKSRELLV